ncbi:unnamed protein product [Cylicocyclus nassatus]|uniref:Protein SPEC3 n=1 Tax=Cylicocyclus nassatus TaxID=53992 RepID=A0AA36DP68_CYLNA|nr:unnamed protein product [Cylicocyclus nassatus]
MLKSSRIPVEKVKGWKFLQKNLHRIIDFGRREGLLVVSGPKDGASASFFNLSQKQITAEASRDTTLFFSSPRKEVILPTNDITLMHEAIPFLPVPVALTCLVLNVIFPGTGTVLSGITALCLGQPRVNAKEGRKLITLVINLLVGISQFFTITFLFVGWFWSIAWGGLLIIHSVQYREALMQRRQEAVATAAIEALTKDSILHRRDVKSLVKIHNQQILDKKALDA